MIVDLRRGRVADHSQAHVVIIGAGPAGIALALRLNDLGVATLLLEAGGDRIGRASQDHYRAASIAPVEHGPTDRFRHRVLGGSSAVWGGRCIPLDPIDLEPRGWIKGSGWPIAYAELAEHYPAALDLCRAGAADFDGGAAIPDAPPPLATRGADLITDRVERFSEPTHFGQAYKARLARSRLVTLLLHAAVTTIDAGPNGRAVKGVSFLFPDGHLGTVAARIVVVATGALETARLLLNSDRDKRCGLGNERDLVGRYYQSHLEGRLGELLVSPAIDGAFDYQRARDGTYCRRYLWLSPSAQRRDRLAGLILRPTHALVADPAHRDSILSAMFLVKRWLLPEYARAFSTTEGAAAHGQAGAGRGHWGNIAMGSPRLAAFAAGWTRHRLLARRKLPSVFFRCANGRYPLEVNAEQTPNPESRVTLASERDRAGMRRLAIDWRLAEADRALVVRGFRAMARGLPPGGGCRLEEPRGGLEAAAATLTRIGGHHLGTARMADHPGAGVVDRHGEAFDVRGLFVAGAATFPTSGFANPTLTLVALSLKLAERIAAVTVRDQYFIGF